jgi:hypothetical protein
MSRAVPPARKASSPPPPPRPKLIVPVSTLLGQDRRSPSIPPQNVLLAACNTTALPLPLRPTSRLVNTPGPPNGAFTPPKNRHAIIAAISSSRFRRRLQRPDSLPAPACATELAIGLLPPCLTVQGQLGGGSLLSTQGPTNSIALAFIFLSPSGQLNPHPRSNG